jgi:hypothetical protein
LNRLIAFEMQLGPFAVAQLRVLAEVLDLTGEAPRQPLKMYVTDTLSNPDDDQGWIPGMLTAIAESRKQANRIKREEPITVVIGNPPYKEKAKGRGGWIEGDDADTDEMSPLSNWFPPKEWGVSAHSKHLRNLYIYFWRWATWKVFDHHPSSSSGIVSFITVAGFLNGPGFQAMRAYLRGTCDQIWVIDCSPEGHQPPVNSRLFQGVQQPICIVMCSKSRRPADTSCVKFRTLPEGTRIEKFEALKELTLQSPGWLECPREGRAPFLPNSKGAWDTYPKVEDIFLYSGSGVMPGRNWVIAPDILSLELRWSRLISSNLEEKENLFHPHLRDGKPGDKHARKIVKKGLAGHPPRTRSVSDDTSPMVPAQEYAFRSFDRQFIIPDARLINQPNPTLWSLHSDHQIYLTALTRTSPSSGPALTFSGLVPDLDHYKGRGGRVFPLWSDATATSSNIKPSFVNYLANTLDQPVSPDDVMAYIGAVAAHPAFTGRFQDDLSTPGLRIPFTADSLLFTEAVALGRRVVWLHSFGERMVDQSQGRPGQPPRVEDSRHPAIPMEGAISGEPDSMPDSIKYDSGSQRLYIGQGYVENVEPSVWNYNVSGKQVVQQWFSYRKKNRDRPLMGDRRPPSPLGGMQPDHWLAEYTTELINLLHVLQLLVDLEPQQAELLERICGSKLISASYLVDSGALLAELSPKKSRPTGSTDQVELF